MLVFVHAASAQGASCPAPTLSKNRQSNLEQSLANTIYISADQVKASVAGKSHMLGNAQFQQNENSLRADAISYDPKKRALYAEGNIQYTSCGTINPEWFLSAEKFFINDDEAAAKTLVCLW